MCALKYLFITTGILKLLQLNSGNRLGLFVFGKVLWTFEKEPLLGGLVKSEGILHLKIVIFETYFESEICYIEHCKFKITVRLFTVVTKYQCW